MTLTSMLAELYRRFGYATSPASEISTRYTAFLNETLQELIAEPGLGGWFTRNEPMAIVASVANQAVYAVPAPTSRIAAITERTNDKRLESRSLQWYRSAEPDPTANTGTPDVWVPLGFQAVSVQPSNASNIFVKSTAAGDTNTAVIEGIRTSGYFFARSVSMTGITAVNLSGVDDMLQVTKFYLSAPAVGEVTLHEDSGAGTELSHIPVGQTFARYEAFALWPTPSSAITYYLESERAVPDMSNNNDEPPFPSRFHRVLVDGASWRECLKKDDSRANDYRARYERGVSQLRYYATCQPDFLPSRQAEMGRSRFGANYPETRY